jgi:hypothetical protein
LGDEHVSSVRRVVFLLGSLPFWGACRCLIKRFAGGDDPFNGFSLNWVLGVIFGGRRHIQP